MNLPMLRFNLGRMLEILAALLCVPLLVGLLYREPMRVLLSYIAVLSVSLLLGIALSCKHPRDTRTFTRDGLVSAALFWVIFSLVGGLPFCLSGEIPSLIDCFFETASGFTTTGATILTRPEDLSQASLFWRSLTHFVGGMGVLVLAAAILPNSGAEDTALLRSEMPGPTFGKITSHIQDTARRYYSLYLAFTLVLILLLILAGMPVFDAFIHAFGTAGTGGFSNHSESVAYFHSIPIETILAVAMLVFSVNFNVYHYFFLRFRHRSEKNKPGVRSEELYWFITIVIIAVVLCSLAILPRYLENNKGMARAMHDAFFTVSSTISTTGFAIYDYNHWPLVVKIIILMLMFVGGCAGSTAGGLKVSRVAMYSKTSVNGIKASRDPRRALPLRFEFKTVSREEQITVMHYLIIYCLFFMGALLIISLDTPDFLDAFTAVSTSLNNVGPGMGIHGPTSNFSTMSDLSKLTMSIAMIAGRLELLPMVALFLFPGHLARRHQQRKATAAPVPVSYERPERERAHRPAGE